MTTITLPIVGARFRPPAEDILDALAIGTELILRRQPDNPHDANAIQVMLPLYVNGNEPIAYPDEIWQLIADNFEAIPTDLHLAYIPREHAAKIAPQMDLAVRDDLTIPDWKGKFAFTKEAMPGVCFDTEQKAVHQCTEKAPQ
jgi:hypothetical protein